MILLIDNYDSFVHNLARYVSELGHATEIIRNDRASVQEILSRAPEAIILSPGPCGPERAGISVELARDAAKAGVPLLGVCLGHQAVAMAFGGTITRAKQPVHGKASLIRHSGHALFGNLPNPFSAGRYHSLVAELSAGSMLKPIAHAEDGELMALRHESAPIFGVQFHPESVLTEHGHTLMKNFLVLAAEANAAKGR